jgi:hypothetical protein
MLSARDSSAREAAASDRRAAGREFHGHPSRPKFTTNEVKLLYALHWIVLDSASECEDADNEAGLRTSANTSSRSYLLSLDDVHLFIFLLAPLVDTVAESDFQTLKLENGLRLWEPLWNYSQPDVPCFTTPVKQHRVLLRAQRPTQARVNFNMANIYVGHADEIYCGDEPSPPQDDAADKRNEEDDDDVREVGDSDSVRESSESESLRAPLARMSDICALSTTETTVSADPSAGVCETCHQPIGAAGGAGCRCALSVTAPMRRSSSVSSDGRSLGLPGVDASRLETAISAFARAYPNLDVISASCFDVAVLRCLFCAQWPEPGVHWGLRYIHRRLLEIVSEKQNNASFQLRQRSQSLPVPKFQMFVSPPGLSTSPSSDHESVIIHDGDSSRQPAFKRARNYESTSCGRSGPPPPPSPSGFLGGATHEHRHSVEIETSRPDSALSRLTENEEDSTVEDEEDDAEDSSSDAAKRSLRGGLQADCGDASKRKQKRDTDEDSSGSGGGGKAGAVSDLHLQKPIITITTDSQAPSPARSPLSWSERLRRNSQLSTNSRQFMQETSIEQEPTVVAPQIQRSLTDSKINYASESGSGDDAVDELPGSMFYVTADGQMDYRVVLMAVHAVSGRAYSSRVCAVLLNVINCLIDLGIVAANVNVSQTTMGSNNHSTLNMGAMSDRLTSKDGRDFDKLSDYHEDSTFCMAVETVFR